jgi:hypothetical protein
VLFSIAARLTCLSVRVLSVAAHDRRTISGPHGLLLSRSSIRERRAEQYAGAVLNCETICPIFGSNESEV